MFIIIIIIIIIIITTTLQKDDRFDELISKFELSKCITVFGWIIRFISNCNKKKVSGPLTISEMKQQQTWFIKREQQKVVDTNNIKSDRHYFNHLKKRGRPLRVQGKNTRTLSNIFTKIINL